MVRKIEVSAFLKSQAGNGISKPIFVIGDDFREYVLKNQKVEEKGRWVTYDCMFLNEMLAYKVGQYLEIPMPEAVVAYVDNAFIEDDPTIRFAYRYEEGDYFATEKLEFIEQNVFDNYLELKSMGKPYIKTTWDSFFKKLHNYYSIPSIIAFDILISNFDRYDNAGNILVNNNINREIYAIDHGHAFWGPQWIQEKVNCMNLASSQNAYIDQYVGQIFNKNRYKGEIFSNLEKYIDLLDVKNHSFIPIVNKIENITENIIDEWIEDIPNEWFLDKKIQASYYKNYLLNQKNAVRLIIQKMAESNMFTNYQGGILEWKNQSQKSHTV